MTLKAYLDHIQAQTGKTPEDFRVLAERKGLLREGVKTGEIVAWLKKDFNLGHGHAMAVVLMIKSATEPRVPAEEQVARHFKGEKVRWRGLYDQLLADVRGFGPEVSVAPTASYISLLRKGKKFAIVQVTADRMDLGIKLKGAKPTRRFEPAGKWNAMVTHRVRIQDPKQVDQEILSWLKQAYDAA
jgi:predicted transport protein